MCGEHAKGSFDYNTDMGSSPRVRGTHLGAILPPVDGGIIPACAGNTRSRPPQTRCPRDHPRVCGEHFDHKGETLPAQGSSPRVRGTHQHDRVRGHDRGIIPACAGNTPPMATRAPLMGDHPRVCGEHVPLDMKPADLQGSSPRVRGTRCSSGSFRGRSGIIPACAGNTSARMPSAVADRDHPRVCGEHSPYRRERG